MSTVSSGIYPLQFVQSLPFRVTSNRSLGFDSSMEEILWSVTADERRIGNPFIFLLYQHPSGVPGQDAFYPNARNELLRLASSYRISEPNPSGAILASGNVNTTDWINDIREALSGVAGGFVIDGLLTLHSFDSTDDVLQSWLGAKSSDGGGNRPWGQRDWTHPYYTASGSPPYPYLGFSGQLFDIDLDEVFYHPIPRFTSFNSAVVAISGIPPVTFGVYPIKPLFPSFAKANGSLITATAADSLVRESTDFHCDHVASGLIRIDGDVILPSGTFNFGGVLGNFVQSGIRNDYWVGAYQPMIARGFISHGSGTTRPSKTIVPVVISHSGVIPTSGERISRYPAITNDFVGIYRRPIGYPDETPFGSSAQAGPSGFEYFTDCLSVPTAYVATTSGPFYGLQLLSPVSHFPVWVRFGSGVNAGAPANYMPDQIVTDLCAQRVSSSTIVSLREFAAGGLWRFLDYDNNIEASFRYYDAIGGRVFTATSLARFWLAGTDIFAIASNLSTGFSKRWEAASITSISGYLNKWSYPVFGTALNYGSNNVDSTVNRRSCVGFFDGTNHFLAVSKAPGSLDLNACSGFSQLTLISGPGGVVDNLYDYGAFEPLVGITLGLSVPLVPICTFRLTSSTDLNTGIWCIFRAPNSVASIPSPVNGDVYLGRIERSVGQWNVVEFYANKKFDIGFSNSLPGSTNSFTGTDLHYIVPITI